MDIVGSIETIDIVSLDLYDLDAKVDTGAANSSIHCDHISIDKVNNKVSFDLLDEVHPAYNGKKITLPLYEIREVKSSNGTTQLRPFVEINVLFFQKEYSLICSLTDRSEMQYPMLLGKSFLKNNFLVDVSKNYLNNLNKGK